MPVLNFLNKKEIKKIFDKDSRLVIDYLLRKTLFSQPEELSGKSNGNIQITKEFLEQWIAQGLGWKKVASGSYPIDVYSEEKKIGADVKSMSIILKEDGRYAKKESGETSLGQKFKGSGNSLDQDFKNKRHAKILNGWKSILVEKMKKPIAEYGLTTIYYFIFIREGNSVSLAVATVNVDKIKNLKVDRATGSSVFVKGYISKKYGSVKIYKAKKRMELRCYPENLWKDNLFINWSFDDLLDEKGEDLRLLVKNKEKFKKYVKRKLDKIFNSL